MNPGIEDRKHLWTYNLDAVRMAMSQVPNLDTSEMMVLVADTQDTVGAVFLEALSHTPEFANAPQDMAKIAAKGDIPTLVGIVSKDVICAALKDINPGVVHHLRTLPLYQGRVWALVIGSEGSMLIQTAVEPIQSRGDA